ncbi:MAG TPA: MBL fold metallo-hydrolase [Nevskiaceae bacterium]|nr:MBL fold metallo-hydrolase [Nevskiaceae bacterium]
MDARTKDALEYPLAAPPPDATVVEVAPGILWVRMPMPMRLNHINLYLLRGDTGWTLVDTGLNTQRTRDLWEKVLARCLDGLPLEHLICTHWHYDHAGLAYWFTQHWGVPLSMTLGEYYTMQAYASPVSKPLPPSMQTFYQRTGMTAEAVVALFDILQPDPLVPPMPRAFERLRAGEQFTIGRHTWRVVVGEGHSPEHACLYDDEHHLLLAGDQLLPKISSTVMVTDREPHADPLALWLASLDRLDGLAEDTLVLPAHGDVFRGLRRRTEQLREHHAGRLGALQDFVRARPRCTALEATHALFVHLHGPVDEMMGLCETLAHVNRLLHAGILRAELDEADVYRYEVCA